MRELLIYGAGGFGREVCQLVEDLIADGAPIRLAGFLSDEPAAHGSVVAGYPILGGASFLASRSGEFDVALAIGAPAIKRQLAAAVASHARSFPTLIHPSVIRSPRLQIGKGGIVCAASVLTVDIRLGAFVTVNLACTIGHDVSLGDFGTIAPGTNLSGNVRLEEGCDIGTGVRVIQGRTIGAWTIVGAGAVVTTDLPANCTAIGVPARAVKSREAGWQNTSRPPGVDPGS